MTPPPEINLAVLDWLWQTTWQVAILIALVAVVCILGRRVLAPRWRYALWLLVAVRLVMPALPGSPVSLFNLMTGESPAPPPEEVASQVVITAGPAMEMMPLEPLSVIVQAPPKVSWSWQQWLIATWLAGAALFAATMLLANVRLLRALRRHGAEADEAMKRLLEESKQIASIRAHPRTRGRVRVIISEALGMPALVGWIRPVIVLPPHLRVSLDDEQLRFVLLHELAHLKRRDVLVQWLLLPLHALHWFNPLVWWAGACLRNERELACDELVLRWTQPQRRVEYGRSLLRVIELASDAGRPRVIAVTAVPMASNNLVRRIDMISRSDKQVLARRGRGIIGLAVIAAVVAVGMTGAADGQQRDPRNEGSRRTAPATERRRAVTTTPAPAQRTHMLIYDHPGGRPMLYDPSTGELRPYNASMYEGGYGGEYGADEAYEEADMADMGSQTPPRGAAPHDPLRATERRRSGDVAHTYLIGAKPDAAGRLGSARIPVGFVETPLRDAIEFIADSADVNIVVHWPHLDRVGVRRDVLVSIRTREPISAASALQLVLEHVSTPTRRLTMEARPDVIVISAEGEAEGGMGLPGFPGGAGIPGMEDPGMTLMLGAAAAPGGRGNVRGSIEADELMLDDAAVTLWPVQGDVEVIDGTLLSKLQYLEVDTADDATFIHHLFVDLKSRTPTPEEMRAFLNDRGPNKRQRWVEQLSQDRNPSTSPLPAPTQETRTAPAANPFNLPRGRSAAPVQAAPDATVPAAPAPLTPPALSQVLPGRRGAAAAEPSITPGTRSAAPASAAGPGAQFLLPGDGGHTPVETHPAQFTTIDTQSWLLEISPEAARRYVFREADRGEDFVLLESKALDDVLKLRDKKVLARPRVLAPEGQHATISIAGEGGRHVELQLRALRAGDADKLRAEVTPRLGDQQFPPVKVTISAGQTIAIDVTPPDSEGQRMILLVKPEAKSPPPAPNE